MGTQPLLIKRLLPLGIRKKPVLLCCSKFFYFGYRKTRTSGEDHLFLSPAGLDTINYYFPGVPLRICSWSYTRTRHQRSCKVLKAIFLFFHQGEVASRFYLFAIINSGTCHWRRTGWCRWRRHIRAVSYTHLTLPTICSV